MVKAAVQIPGSPQQVLEGKFLFVGVLNDSPIGKQFEVTGAGEACRHEVVELTGAMLTAGFIRAMQLVLEANPDMDIDTAYDWVFKQVMEPVNKAVEQIFEGPSGEDEEEHVHA